MCGSTTCATRMSSTRQKNIILKSRKPKLQDGFDSLGFLFLYRQLFKEVMDLVDNLYTAVWEYIYLFNQQIGQLGS